MLQWAKSWKSKGFVHWGRWLRWSTSGRSYTPRWWVEAELRSAGERKEGRGLSLHHSQRSATCPPLFWSRFFSAPIGVDSGLFLGASLRSLFLVYFTWYRHSHFCLFPFLLFIYLRRYCRCSLKFKKKKRRRKKMFVMPIHLAGFNWNLALGPLFSYNFLLFSFLCLAFGSNISNGCEDSESLWKKCFRGLEDGKTSLIRYQGGPARGVWRGHLI